TPTWRQNPLTMDTPCSQGEPKTYLNPVQALSESNMSRTAAENKSNWIRPPAVEITKNNQKTTTLGLA
ncbi:hypothetical protein, partial [Sphingobacterium sp. UBA1897]|uniref:hypothetical protein n=1 Tax=Sphingobacterium sp. UBA1897 TaxID=1947486 RepID=UPI002580431D